MLQWRADFEPGDLAWMLVAIVVQLTLVWPGSTLFFFGLWGQTDFSRLAKLGLILLAVMTLVWCLGAYSIAFAPSWNSVPQADPNKASYVFSSLEAMAEYMDAQPDETNTQGRGGVIGGTDFVALRGISPVAGTEVSAFPTRRPDHHLPHLLFMMFHATLFVAAVSPLLIALFEFWTDARLLAFAAVWGTLIYSPLVHWIVGDGWLSDQGVLDSGCGLVHICVGFSALAGSIVVSRWSKTAGDLGTVTQPPNVGLASVGALMFWCGNLIVQSAAVGTPDGRAVLAMANSHLATAAGVVAWLATSRFVWQQSNPMSPAAAAVCSMVAISAGSSLLLPQSAVVLGIASGILGGTAFAPLLLRTASLHQRLRSLVWLLGLSSALGALLTGVFAISSAGGYRWDGRIVTGVMEGNTGQLPIQALAVIIAAAWGLIGTAAIVSVMTLVVSPNTGPLQRRE